MHHGKDGSVGRHAQRKRGDRRERKPSVLPQEPERKTEILEQTFHSDFDAATAARGFRNTDERQHPRVSTSVPQVPFVASFFRVSVLPGLSLYGAAPL